MADPGEPEPMRTLVTGNNPLQGGRSSLVWNRRDVGFTLIEFLVAMAVMATLLGIAVLAIPNHDERYWRDNLDQLVDSLNAAQEESAMSGTPVLAQVDSQGWRFSISVNHRIAATAENISGGAFLPDVYRAQTWYKPVEITPLQLSLGAEYVMPVLEVSIKQGGRQALLLRGANGRFRWMKL